MASDAEEEREFAMRKQRRGGSGGMSLLLGLSGGALTGGISLADNELPPGGRPMAVWSLHADVTLTCHLGMQLVIV